MTTSSDLLNDRIREHAETVEWDKKSFIRELYCWYDLFNERLFSASLSRPVISCDVAHAKMRAKFYTKRNGIGLDNVLRFNESYANRPISETLVDLLIQMCFQEAADQGREAATMRKDVKDRIIECGVLLNDQNHPCGITGELGKMLEEFNLIPTVPVLEPADLTGKEETIIKPVKTNNNRWALVCACGTIGVTSKAFLDSPPICSMCGMVFQEKGTAAILERFDKED